MNFKRVIRALVLALILAFAAPAHAQMPIVYYWGCSYSVFGWYFSQTTISTTMPGDPSSWDGALGWRCYYLFQCSFTQDLAGNVRSYCN